MGPFPLKNNNLDLIKNALRAYKIDEAIELMANFILANMSSRRLWDIDHGLSVDLYRNIIKRAEELALKKA